MMGDLEVWQPCFISSLSELD